MAQPFFYGVALQFYMKLSLSLSLQQYFILNFQVRPIECGFASINVKEKCQIQNLVSSYELQNELMQAFLPAYSTQSWINSFDSSLLHIPQQDITILCIQ